MLSVEKVSCREGFAALEPIWNGLLEQSLSDTIALTHQWLFTWWNIFGEGRELYILLVRDAGEVIGIAPLVKRRLFRLGLPYRRLEFLATGEEAADEICSNYLDFILRRGREEEILQAIFDFLKIENGWDELLLKELAASSPTVPLLEKLGSAHKLKCDTQPDGESIYLPLPDTWESLLASFDKRDRGHCRRDLERSRQPDCSLDVFDAPENFSDGFDALVELHQNLWTSRGEPGAFASEKFTHFHRDVIAKLLSPKQVQLFILRFENKPFAGVYAFFYKGTAFFYQSGYAAGGPFHSPGTLIRNFAMQHAITEGIREWDFLKAEPGSYKYRWSKHTRSFVQMRLAKPHFKESVFTVLCRVVDRLRPVKRALKRRLHRQKVLLSDKPAKASVLSSVKPTSTDARTEVR